MTDAPPTHDHGTATTGRPFSSLAPTVRSIVFDAVPPHDRSLPVAFCAIAGTVGSAIERSDASDRPAAELLEPVTNAVAFLEGYVRIRAELLGGDRYDDDDRRDVAVLASDFLHAAAYAPMATVSVTDRRALELYRVLADGSSSLAIQFMRSVDDADETAPGAPASSLSHPTVTLAETAATLGATAVDASDDVRTAMETYAQSLSAALLATGTRTEVGVGTETETETGTAETSPLDPRTTAVRVLSGRTATGTDTEPGTDADAGTKSESAGDDAAMTARSSVGDDAIATPNRRRRSTDVSARGNEPDEPNQPHKTHESTGNTEPNTHTHSNSSLEQIESHLERARGALETLEDLAVAADAPNRHDVDRSPIDRLERATRIPFQHE